jgi:hypothetical protein
MLNKLVLYCRSSIFAPLKNERDSVSAEELLDKQKQNTLKRNRRKKL